MTHCRVSGIFHCAARHRSLGDIRGFAHLKLLRSWRSGLTQGNCSITMRGTQKGNILMKRGWHDICLLVSLTTLRSLAEHLLPLE